MCGWEREASGKVEHRGGVGILRLWIDSFRKQLRACSGLTRMKSGSLEKSGTSKLP